MTFKLFGASWCNPCKMAKQIMEQKGLDYTFFDVDIPENAEALNKLLGAPARAIPVIFVGDECTRITLDQLKQDY